MEQDHLVGYFFLQGHDNAVHLGFVVREVLAMVCHEVLKLSEDVPPALHLRQISLSALGSYGHLSCLALWGQGVLG